MKADSAGIPLFRGGVTVTVGTKTDSRGVMDCLLSPLAKITSTAARER
jgi:hypothetical protein